MTSARALDFVRAYSQLASLWLDEDSSTGDRQAANFEFIAQAWFMAAKDLRKKEESSAKLQTNG